LSQRNRRKYTATSFSVGDIVLVANDLQKRLDWPIARIKELFPGKDGLVRVVKLQTANGELIRPIQRLISLEVEHHDDDSKRYSDLVTTAVEESSKSIPEPTIRTKSGRIIKKPERLGF